MRNRIDFYQSADEIFQFVRWADGTRASARPSHMRFQIFLVCLLVRVQRACCWQTFGHLRLEATLRLITCLCSCADTPDHLQSFTSRWHAPEKAQGSRFEICPHTGALRVSLAKEAVLHFWANMWAILSWRWLFSVAHGVNGISLKFHRIPAKPICHVRFLLFSGLKLILFHARIFAFFQLSFSFWAVSSALNVSNVIEAC